MSDVLGVMESWEAGRTTVRTAEGELVTIAVADIVSLGKRSGVARIDITNGGKAVCAAQGTVTIVSPAGDGR